MLQKGFNMIIAPIIAILIKKKLPQFSLLSFSRWEQPKIHLNRLNII